MKVKLDMIITKQEEEILTKVINWIDDIDYDDWMTLTEEVRDSLEDVHENIHKVLKIVSVEK